MPTSEYGTYACVKVYTLPDPFAASRPAMRARTRTELRAQARKVYQL